jgi:ATP phosphoribosyltransferase
MNAANLVLAVPSKGRLKDEAERLFATAGLTFLQTGHERGYRGELQGFDGVEVAFVSAAEIARLLQSGEAHLGITGEDLIRETIAETEKHVTLLAPLGFGHADVVVAVPDFWIDVATMADLEEAAVLYRRRHRSRMRVATKYMNLTRQFFAGHRFGRPDRAADAVTLYRIVESLGATEGAPGAGTAELIVDITSTGSTLKANGLKVLSDGVILRSQANLVASRTATWTASQKTVGDGLMNRLNLPARP